MAYRSNNRSNFRKLENWHVAADTLRAGNAQHAKPLSVLNEVLSAMARFQDAIEKAEGCGCVFSFKPSRVSWARSDDGMTVFEGNALSQSRATIDVDSMTQEQKAELIRALTGVPVRKSKLIKAKR